MSLSQADLRNIAQAFVDDDTARTQNLDEIRQRHAGIGEPEDDNDTLVSLVDSFNPRAVKKATNFTETELRLIYSTIEDSFATHGRRGRKPKYWGFDAFFLLVSCFKHCKTWAEFAQRWKFKTESAAMRFIVRVIDVVHEPLTAHYIVPFSRVQQMNNGWIRPDSPFPEAVAVTDTKFQQCYRPKGRFNESRAYFSKKHGAFGLKFESTHARNGRCMSYSPHFAGAKHDFSIFRSRLEVHKKLLAKSREERTLPDNAPLQDTFPNMWPQLADKAYVGGAEIGLRVLTPFKNSLTQAQMAHDRLVGSGRVVVENFYGRMVQLWGIIAKKWRWDHQLYDRVVGICIALTNAHLDNNPLRQDEGQFYTSLLNEYAELHQQQMERERLTKQRSRANQQRHLQALNQV